MWGFNRCEIHYIANLQKPIALVPNGKDVQVGWNDLVTHFLVHLFCRQPELPETLFFGRIQRILQLLGRGILIRSAKAKICSRNLSRLIVALLTGHKAKRVRRRAAFLSHSDGAGRGSLFPPGTKSVRLDSLSFAGY